MDEMKTTSAPATADSRRGSTFMSTRVTSQSSGSMAATVSSPSGGKRRLLADEAQRVAHAPVRRGHFGVDKQSLQAHRTSSPKAQGLPGQSSPPPRCRQGSRDEPRLQERCREEFSALVEGQPAGSEKARHRLRGWLVARRVDRRHPGGGGRDRQHRRGRWRCSLLLRRWLGSRFSCAARPAPRCVRRDHQRQPRRPGLTGPDAASRMPAPGQGKGVRAPAAPRL